jgi:hypothetical protein
MNCRDRVNLNVYACGSKNWEMVVYIRCTYLASTGVNDPGTFAISTAGLSNNSCIPAPAILRGGVIQ